LVFYKEKLYCRNRYVEDDEKPLLIFSADTLARDTKAEEALKFDDTTGAITL
jgi:hypothetical protein